MTHQNHIAFARRLARVPLLGLALAACGGSGPEIVRDEVRREPPPTETAKPVAASVVCVPGDDLYFEQQALDGGQYRFCVADPSAAAAPYTKCFTFDLASATLTTRPAPPEVQPTETPEAPPVDPQVGDHWKYEVGKQRFSVCAAADRCKAVKVARGLAPSPYEPPSVSADGKLLVATFRKGDPEVEGGRPWIYVWEIATGKQLTGKQVGDDSYKCGGASFLGDTLLVALDVCAGPGGIAWLAKPQGLAKIAELGPEGFGQYGPMADHLEGTKWLFLEQGGKSLLVQDVASGAIVSHLSLEKEFPAYEIGEGETGYSVPADGGGMWRLPSGEIAVALEGQAGKLAIVDATATKIVKVHSFPRCAPLATP